MKELEKAFTDTMRVLLGTPLAGMDGYGEWRGRNTRGKRAVVSSMGKNKVGVPRLSFFDAAKRGFITLGVWGNFGERKIPADEAAALDLGNAHRKLAPIAYFTPEAVVGECEAVEDDPTYFYSSYCARGIYSSMSKFCGYCYWPRTCEYVFGCSEVFQCKFCVKCYYSENLTRCFEVSDSHSCSDCYFCHNCENCNDCMFCFNAKNLRYAVGNVEVGREQYA